MLASPALCLRHRSATENPTSRSFKIPMICSSGKRLRFMLWSPSWARANFKLDQARGARSDGTNLMVKSNPSSNNTLRRDHPYFLNNRGICQTIGGTKGFITSSTRRRRTSLGRILNIVV